MRGRVDWLGRMRVPERAEGHPRRLGADGRAVAPWSTSAARIGMYLPTPRVAARGTPGRKLRCHAYAASDCHLRGRGLWESTGGPSAPPTVPLLNHTDVPMPPTDCCRSYGRFSHSIASCGYRPRAPHPTLPQVGTPTISFVDTQGRGVTAPPAPGRGVTAPPALGRDCRRVLRVERSGGTSSRHRLLPDRCSTSRHPNGAYSSGIL